MAPAAAPAVASKGKVALVALGCPKNTVDAEVFLGDLSQHGYEIVDETIGADVIVVNTCAFIEDAQRESVHAILEAAKAKQSGARALIVTGCLAQRYAGELATELPEVDAVVGFESYAQLPQHIDALLSRLAGAAPSRVQVGEVSVPFRVEYLRHRLGARHTAYLRVAEGCDHRCTFCAIPRWRGRFRSKPYDQLLWEARYLVEHTGVRELCLIAEDTNMYGMDLGPHGDPRRLADLLRELDRTLVPLGLRWIRLLYCYPSYFSDDLIDAIAECPSVVKYVDMPLQHASDAVLRRMQRPSAAHHQRILQALRRRIPQVALRSTFICGTPGETAADHRQLVQYMRGERFARAGFFVYSTEDGTPMADMGARVPRPVQEARRDELVSLQQRVQEEMARALVDTEVDVMIDAVEDGHCVGRTPWDAPEIDGQVHLLQDRFAPGDVIRARVVGVSGSDLLCSAM